MRAKTLTRLVLDASERVPDRPALRVGTKTLTYEVLVGRAAATAQAIGPAIEGPPRTLVWVGDGDAPYVAALAALLAGTAYVPLNPEFPDSRLADIVARSEAPVMLVDEVQLTAVADRLRSVAPEAELMPVASEQAALSSVVDDEDRVAYLLFTSGSTGKPKGVPVRHRNAVPLIEYMIEHYAMGPTDVCSQMFDMTFDLSVHSIFTAWGAGACLAVPSAAQRISPSHYIRDSGLTCWYSVPSVTEFMRRQGQLRPGMYPLLRCVLFCGEALSHLAAQRWRSAAPSAVIDNHYGPTEAAMSVTGYRVKESESGVASGVVPIGWPYPGVDVFVVDEELREVAPGDSGELLLGGAQVTDGYWRDPERSAIAFIHVPWYGGVLYRTGDRVVRPPDSSHPIEYIGRVDNQVKLLGHRVELGDVESAAREALSHDSVAAVPWPPTDEGYGGLVLFVGGEVPEHDQLLRNLNQRLPQYMLPKEILARDQLPLNSNGKIDRPALRAELEERRARQRA